MNILIRRLFVAGLVSLAAFAGTTARAVPLIVQGPGTTPTEPSIQVTDDLLPITQNGDFNFSTPDVVRYFFSGVLGGVTMSGTAISTPFNAPPRLTITGPAEIAPPAFFDPGGPIGGTASAYFWGNAGAADDLMALNTWGVPSIPGQNFILTVRMGGFVFFPAPGNALVNFELSVNFGGLAVTSNFNVVQPGVGLFPIPPLLAIAVGGVASGPQGMTGWVQLTTRFIDGPAAVYLPASLEAQLEPIPEPGGAVLVGVGLAGLLGYAGRGRLRGRRAARTRGA